MKSEYFVEEHSIVRKIWGKSDTILLIFAGASAEFALNKAVDWLYFTGRIPKDPLGRLFSTVAYARKIVFSKEQSALKAIEGINSIHGSVESKREKAIPDWAYRDVLFMLIDYSIRSFEILERTLKPSEKDEVYDVFFRVGKRMHLKGLPTNFSRFEKMRKNHIEQHLQYGEYTRDLYKQYSMHLGWARYRLLIETQILITPKKVRQLILPRGISVLSPLIIFYKFSRSLKIDWLLKELILPPEYKEQINSMDQASLANHL